MKLCSFVAEFVILFIQILCVIWTINNSRFLLLLVDSPFTFRLLPLAIRLLIFRFASPVNKSKSNYLSYCNNNSFVLLFERVMCKISYHTQLIKGFKTILYAFQIEINYYFVCTVHVFMLQTMTFVHQPLSLRLRCTHLYIRFLSLLVGHLERSVFESTWNRAHFEVMNFELITIWS